jgi:glyoxylase-like metal-dependent hydrolase (beta-lactamase superfamily II)
MSKVERIITSNGRKLYTFPVPAFPTLIANIYLLSDGDQLTLIDCGSGREESNHALLEGFAAVAETFGEPVSLADVDVIVITHGHIDHFGGLPFVRSFTKAPVGVHPLDRRVLSHYEERVIVASRLLESFLQRAGVAVRDRANLMAMYLFAKDVYHSTPVDFLLEAGQSILNDVQIYHVPGHCPGQVCLQFDDVLLTADHVLSRTTPHQAPESITNHMGLGHYLDSLQAIAGLTGVRLSLGGHEAPMADLPGRIQAIRQVHEERLERILDICREPRSAADISRELFGSVSSYHILLALEETGAHVEYLYQRGELIAANLKQIEDSPDPNAVIEYQRP